jgi:hypothetical protein
MSALGQKQPLGTTTSGLQFSGKLLADAHYNASRALSRLNRKRLTDASYSQSRSLKRFP